MFLNVLNLAIIRKGTKYLEIGKPINTIKSSLFKKKYIDEFLVNFSFIHKIKFEEFNR